MKKIVFITNGTGGCGKDTFAQLLNEILPVYKYSSISRVKLIAYECGWNGRKDEKDRKFLSDLKRLLTEYSDLPFEDIKKRHREWLFDDKLPVMIIDIREPEEIQRAKEAFDAQTILIVNDRVKPITSNMADANVLDYNYDIIIENNGTIDDFRNTISEFASHYIFNKEND